jgi:hypothetical protein
VDIVFDDSVGIAVRAGVWKILEMRISEVGDRRWMAGRWLCCEEITGDTAGKNSAFAKEVG